MINKQAVLCVHTECAVEYGKNRTQCAIRVCTRYSSRSPGMFANYVESASIRADPRKFGKNFCWWWGTKKKRLSLVAHWCVGEVWTHTHFLAQSVWTKRIAAERDHMNYDWAWWMEMFGAGGKAPDRTLLVNYSRYSKRVNGLPSER